MLSKTQFAKYLHGRILKSYRLVVLCGLIFMSSSALRAQNWEVKSAAVAFRIKNAGLTVKGAFGGFKGTINFSPASLATAELRGSVDATAISTGITMRDNHLKKDEYFDIEKYPQITMVSRKIVKTDKGYSGLFDIKIKGVTKQATIPFTFVENGKTATLNATFDINRLDYGVGGKSFVMSNTATVTIDLSVEKK